MIDKDFIFSITEKAIEGSSMFITTVDVKPGNRITVFLDGDNGVSIEECVRVSRQIESSLNRDSEDFELNVSSHGLTNPLIVARQYVKNIGKEVNVKMPDGKKMNGILFSADDQGFCLRHPAGKKDKTTPQQFNEIHFKYTEVKEVKISISF